MKSYTSDPGRNQQTLKNKYQCTTKQFQDKPSSKPKPTTKQFTTKPVTTPPIHNKNKDTPTETQLKYISDDLLDLQWLTTALRDEPKSHETPVLNTPVLLNTPVQNEWITLDEIGTLEVDVHAF